MKLFRFLSNQSSRYAYAGLIDNVEKALSRCFFGMARDGRALNKIPLTRCRICRYSRSNPEPKAGFAIGRQILHQFNFGGRVKGASPLVFICPLHINNKNH